MKSLCATMMLCVTSVGAAAAAEPAALYELTLEKAIAGERPLIVYVSAREGKAVAAWAAVQPHRFLPEPVDAATLKAGAAGLAGEVKTVVHSRAWGAKDDRPLRLELSLECKLAGDKVAGSYRGTCGDAKVGGAVAGVAQAVPRSAAAAKGWPNWRGPTCSGTALDSGIELGDGVETAPLLWESQEKSFSGYGGRPTAFLQVCYASPVIAGGNVYLFWADPNGPTIDPNWQAKALDIAAGNAEGVGFKSYASAAGLDVATWARKYASIEADDVLVCMDANTGRTRWRAAFVEHGIAAKHQGRGITIQSKLADQLTMCVGGGKAFFVGSMGGAYCLDAATGRPIWESTIPDYFEFFSKQRQHFAAIKAVPMPKREQICAGMVYAATPDGRGVFVASDAGGYDESTGKHGGSGNGLAGFDAETGKILWRVPRMLGRMGSPLRWTCQGPSGPGQSVDYIIGVNEEATCIEPATGKVLWHVPVAHNGSTTPAVSGDMLIVSGQGGGKEAATAGVAAYRITPQGATKVWEADKRYPLSGYPAPMIWRGHVYYLSWGNGFICLDLQTGKFVAKTGVPCPAGGCGCPVAGDGRIFMEAGGQGVCAVKMDPRDFRVSGWGSRPVNFSCSTTPAYADGRLVVRCAIGVKCLDMRKSAALPMDPKYRDKRVVKEVDDGDDDPPKAKPAKGATTKPAAGSKATPPPLRPPVKPGEKKPGIDGLDL